MKERRLAEKPCFTAAAASDHKNVFVSPQSDRIGAAYLGLFRSARHCDTLGLRDGDIVEKILVHKRGDIRRSAPSGAAVLHTVAVFLCVLALEMYDQADNDRARNADQEVKKVEAGRKGGKGTCKSVPDGEYLCGEVCPRCQTEGLGYLVEGIHEQHIREVG